MTKHIIGLVGYKRSGKSTAAQHLIENHGYVSHNFKDALIAEVKEKFPDLLQEIKERAGGDRIDFTLDELFTIKPPLIRALLMNHGTEVRRAGNPDYWVLEWKLGLVERMMNNERLFVCDDVRFMNESQAIKGWGGTLIRIKRIDITTGGNHTSETEQVEIECDYTITVGAGEHEKLYAELDRIIK
jgi:hypothetical protein